MTTNAVFNISLLCNNNVEIKTARQTSRNLESYLKSTLEGNLKNWNLFSPVFQK